MPLEMSLRLLSVLASESLHPVGQLVRVAGLAEQGRVVEVRHNLAALDARGGADEGALIRRGRGDVSDVGSRYVKNRGRVIRKAMEGGHIPLAVELLDEVASGRRSSELLLALRWVIEGLGTGEGGGQTGRASLLEAGYRYLALIEPGTVAFATRVAMEADLAEAAGDIPGSVVIYRNALARFPEVPSLHHRLAELLLRQGEDFDEASRVADQAFAINPGYASIHLATKGWCQFQHGAFSTARELLERALRHTPEASSGLAIRTLTRLSHTYRELGQPLAAEQMARRRDWLAFDRIQPRRASSFD
jgi:tetratricopeptide (TPR) repeat protein